MPAWLSPCLSSLFKNSTIPSRPFQKTPLPWKLFLFPAMDDLVILFAKKPLLWLSSSLVICILICSYSTASAIVHFVSLNLEHSPVRINAESIYQHGKWSGLSLFAVNLPGDRVTPFSENYPSLSFKTLKFLFCQVDLLPFSVFSYWLNHTPWSHGQFLFRLPPLMARPQSGIWPGVLTQQLISPMDLTTYEWPMRLMS